MHRSLVLMAMLIPLAASGCGIFQHQSTPQETQAARQRWITHKIAADHQRLLGEPGCPAIRPLIILGTDVSGENFFYATCDILWNGSIFLYQEYSGQLNPAGIAREMEMNENPDLQREAILKLAAYSWGQKPPYTDRYKQLVADPDVDYTVWAGAMRALNRARVHEATPLFIRLLDFPQGRPNPTQRETENWLHQSAEVRDAAARQQETQAAYRYQVGSEALVRLEAAKALANIPDEHAERAIIDHLLHDQDKDVRIACADALRNYHTLETAQVLANSLIDADFGVAWQARLSLIVMTGQDFRYDRNQWLKYLGENPSPFVG